MTSNTNPQAEQMADESMVRGLAAQARAIWPQEQVLFERYDLPDRPRILDLACGTGEITERLARLLPTATLLGLDILEDHLERARERCASLGARVEFRKGDAYDIEAADDSFDLVLCRHLLQAIPRPEDVLLELRRVTRPGGRVHIVAEDYAMMHFHPTPLDADEFWRLGPITFAAGTGTDLRGGRKMFTYLKRLGLRDITVNYIVVDTTRVEREDFADIWRAWRDGYAATIARETKFDLEEVLAHFDGMLGAIESPDGYGVWQLPLVSGVV